MKNNQIEDIKKITIKILKKHGVRRIAIFGSYARGDAKKKSDIDLLVEFSEKKSLFDIVGAEIELSDALQRKVDLLTEKSISPYLIDDIKREAKVIYE